MAKLLVLLCLLSFGICANAQTGENRSEKKVDYLERIYFSGENKAGLNTKILIALQELQEKAPTPPLAKQVTFLLDVKDKAGNAENACAILDMLAVGIYNIDAAEAVQQGVLAPSDKAKAQTVDAIASLNKLSSTSSALSSGATNLMWSNVLLNGGNYGSFAAGAGKVAGVAGTVGMAANAAGQAGQTVKQVGELGKMMGFKKKDKPCDDVQKKDIQIGEHAALAATANGAAAPNTNTAAGSTAGVSTTVINIQGISSANLRVFTEALKTKTGVQSAEKSFSETASTITVLHSGSTDSLSDWIEDKFSTKYKLIGYSNGKISLSSKVK